MTWYHRSTGELEGRRWCMACADDGESEGFATHPAKASSYRDEDGQACVCGHYLDGGTPPMTTAPDPIRASEPLTPEWVAHLRERAEDGRWIAAEDFLAILDERDALRAALPEDPWVASDDGERWCYACDHEDTSAGPVGPVHEPDCPWLLARAASPEQGL